MSDSNKVKITSKRTGEVSSAQTARAAMQPKNEKNQVPDDTEGKLIQQVGAEENAPTHDQEKANPVENEKTTSRKKASTKKPAKVTINSLADFLVYAYSRKGKNLKSLTVGEIKAVTKNARLTEREREDLLVLSKNDSLLAVPRQIVFAVQEIDGPPLIRQEVHRFLSDVLKRHPLYQHNNLVPVIANTDDAIEPLEAIRIVAKLSPKALASLTGLENPKPKDVEALRSNAINCLVLWLWKSRGQQVNRMIRWLYEGYWSAVTPSDASSTTFLKVVTSITEVTGVGMACQQFKTDADESALRATELQAKIDSLLVEIRGLRQTVGDLEEVIFQRDNTISGLSQELDAERSAHANSRSHLGDDFEHMRSNVVRCLKREVSLLTEGLQALRKDPPKVRVMDDHAERVLEGLQAAMKDLEEEG